MFLNFTKSLFFILKLLKKFFFFSSLFLSLYYSKNSLQSLGMKKELFKVQGRKQTFSKVQEPKQYFTQYLTIQILKYSLFILPNKKRKRNTHFLKHVLQQQNQEKKCVDSLSLFSIMAFTYSTSIGGYKHPPVAILQPKFQKTPHNRVQVSKKFCNL